jgi:hypothetical protein
MNLDNLGDSLLADFSDTIPLDLGTQLEQEPAAQPTNNEILGIEPWKLSDELRTAIATGWRATYALLFDKAERPFVANLGRHHRRAIKWHWASRHRVCKTNRWELDERASFVNGGLTREEFEATIREYLDTHRPQWYAYFPIWSRGHMKSTIARRIAVVDALISMYYKLPGYCLYFSGTDAKTEKHALSIEALLRSIREHAPALAAVKRSDVGGKSLGWKASFLNTAANYVYHFGSLQSGLAGANLEDVRPTMMIPDDIDDRKDSVVMSEKNFQLLTTEILPMGSKGTLTLWAQNLITRFSSMYRIYKQQAKVLVNRMAAKPIPAVEGIVWDVQTVDGIVRDVIVGGTPTWPYFSLEDCQDEVNRIGKPAFLSECQHQVEAAREGLLLKNYEDKLHVISESEFASRYGSLDAWRLFNKWIYHDWARTKSEFHANIAGFLAVASAGGFLPGAKFLFHPMSFPAASAAHDVAERILSKLSPMTIAADDGKRYTWQELRVDEFKRNRVHDHVGTVKEKLAFENDVIAKLIPKYSKPLLDSWNVRGGAMSHSEDTIREILNAYGIRLTPSNPAQYEEIDNIDRDFLVDYAEEHPFRPGVMGYTRMFIVVPDWKDCPEAEIRIDERTGKKIYPPVPCPDDLSPENLHDEALMRYQFMNWRTRPPTLTETGEQIDGILKLNDDFGQGLQMLYKAKRITNVPLDEKAVVEAHTPASLSEAAIEQAPEDTRDLILQARILKQEEIRKDLRKPVVSAGMARLRKR